MRIGAIDIGTNAVRLVVKEVTKFRDSYHSHKICYTRVPIRLGEDVFSSGKIEEEKFNQLEKTIQAFKHLLDVLNVSEYRACSTSAMREASNGKEVIEQIKNKTDVQIELLSGQEEAQTIMSNFASMDLEPEQHYLYIDVGGGSTEISLILNGEVLLSKSFKVGTVRLLREKVTEQTWADLREFTALIERDYAAVIAIGTGGNINRIFKQARKVQMDNLYVEEIEKIREKINSYTFEERLHLLKLKPDRADVIIPAADIFIEVMNSAGVIEMIVPKIGLSDGIILRMFDDLQEKHLFS